MNLKKNILLPDLLEAWRILAPCLFHAGYLVQGISTEVALNQVLMRVSQVLRKVFQMALTRVLGV